MTFPQQDPAPAELGPKPNGPLTYTIAKGANALPNFDPDTLDSGLEALAKEVDRVETNRNRRRAITRAITWTLINILIPAGIAASVAMTVVCALQR